MGKAEPEEVVYSNTCLFSLRITKMSQTESFAKNK